MAIFAEDVIKEYPPIPKRTTPTKTVTYRIRVLWRKVDGIMRKLVDIREFLVNNKRALFTESGIYLNAEELDKLIITLNDIKKNYFKDGWRK